MITLLIIDMLNYWIKSFFKNVSFSKNFIIEQQDESLKYDEEFLKFNIHKRISDE